MNTILISGVMNQSGKTTVLKALEAYWRWYCSDQTVSCLTIPAMESISLSEKEHNLADLWQLLSRHQCEHDKVILEGAGSLGTPVTFDTTMAALARDWRLPTLLVVPVEWQAIAPTIAAIALARQTYLDFIGIILNHRSPSSIPEEQYPGCSEHSKISKTTDDIVYGASKISTLEINTSRDNEIEMIDLLRSLTQVPIIGVIPFLGDLDDERSLAQSASNLMIEKLL